MTQSHIGWIVFLAALGMMATMTAVDIGQLHSWAEAKDPSFAGSVLGHFGAVIAAFVGGKLLPQFPTSS